MGGIGFEARGGAVRKVPAEAERVAVGVKRPVSDEQDLQRGIS